MEFTALEQWEKECGLFQQARARERKEETPCFNRYPLGLPLPLTVPLALALALPLPLPLPPPLPLRLPLPLPLSR